VILQAMVDAMPHLESPQGFGPAQRLLAQAGTQAGVDAATGEPAIAVTWVFPGGAIFDTRSPHDRDLLDPGYLTNHYVDAPSSIDAIVQAGESRWVFR
jgi:hypothetical protein